MLQSKRFQSHVPALQNHGRNQHLLGHICKYFARIRRPKKLYASCERVGYQAALALKLY